MIPPGRWALPELHLRVKAPCALLFVYTLLLAADTTGVFRLGILCALLHECGHIAVFAALEHRLPALEASFGGICLSMRGVLLPPGKELLLAAAGPAVNLLLAAGMLTWMEGPAGYGYFGLWFVCTNLLVGGFNLLPLPGLDGWRMAGCLRLLAQRVWKNRRTPYI